VFDVIRRGNLVTAKVEGSAFEPYRVQVTVSDAGIAATSCTCPYDGGGICKHVVATLLVVMHEPETIAEKPTLTALLADLTADQLRQVLMGIAEEGPAFAEAIEREVDTAVEQSWSYAPLVRVMQGNITEKGAWEGEAPYYAAFALNK
jgi:uncharacterized Zn finger protein